MKTNFLKRTTYLMTLDFMLERLSKSTPLSDNTIKIVISMYLSHQFTELETGDAHGFK